MTIRINKLDTSLLNSLGRRNQINQWLLSFVIPIDAISFQIEHHWRQITEIKGHVIMNRPARPHRNRYIGASTMNFGAVTETIG